MINTNAQPHEIDTGDRTLVTTKISKVHKNGVLLKFLYDEGLAYVPESAKIIFNEVEKRVSPIVNSPGDDGVFLVFFLKQNDFGEDGEERGELIFELEGLDTVTEGRVAADADVHDVRVDPEAEFDLENPEFSAETSTDISVNNSVTDR